MTTAFKEWAIICELLGTGQQSLILRKGGIAEGRDGFAFKHDRFHLMPTRFHEQIARTTLPADTPIPAGAPEGWHHIQYLAEISRTLVIRDLDIALALAPLHHWREEIVRERFSYDEEPGISAALVRVYQLEPRHAFEDAPRYGGCRSWVQIPEPPDATTLTPVLDEETHTRALAKFDALVAQATGPASG